MATFKVGLKSGLTVDVEADFMDITQQARNEGVYFYNYATDPNSPVKAYIVAWFDDAASVIRESSIFEGDR